MGVTIRCKRTHDSIDMGAGGFLRLRRKVADLYGEPWASHYRTLTDTPPSRQTDEWYEAFDEKTKELLEAKLVSVKIVDFCLQSDVRGAIRYGACKQILKAIGDYDDDLCYGYAGRPDCAMFRDFRRLLEQCAENRCDLVWD